MTREEFERIIRQMAARYHVRSAYKDNDPSWDARFNMVKNTPADRFEDFLEFSFSGKARNYLNKLSADELDSLFSRLPGERRNFKNSSSNEENDLGDEEDLDFSHTDLDPEIEYSGNTIKDQHKKLTTLHKQQTDTSNTIPSNSINQTSANLHNLKKITLT